MLTLDPGTMYGMTDEHLTPCERELLKRWECALDSKGVSIDEIEPNIAEALGSYPAEDFLSELQSQLRELSGNLRGANKEKCLEILEGVDDLAQCIHNQSEYGRSELRSILNGR